MTEWDYRYSTAWDLTIPGNSERANTYQELVNTVQEFSTSITVQKQNIIQLYNAFKGQRAACEAIELHIPPMLKALVVALKTHRQQIEAVTAKAYAPGRTAVIPLEHVYKGSLTVTKFDTRLSQDVESDLLNYQAKVLALWPILMSYQAAVQELLVTLNKLSIAQIQVVQYLQAFEKDLATPYIPGAAEYYTNPVLALPIAVHRWRAVVLLIAALIIALLWMSLKAYQTARQVSQLR